mgnify:CR=1 FL=1
MTQERLLKLLNNPDLLSTISYEEMKTVALSYPYAHNLRYLLALKAHQDNHPDAGRALMAAAAYSLDRKQLFHLAAPRQLAPQPVAVAWEEAVLELKPIGVVQRELEALAPRARVEEPIVLATKEAPAAPAPVPVPALPTEEKKTAAPELPKVTLSQPFAVWMSRFNPPVLDSRSGTDTTEPAVHQPEEKAETGSTPALSAHELAERSVSENKDVISETLARLLAKQGYRDKAINMYQRLCLAFPEKSAFFAAEIEKLKK